MVFDWNSGIRLPATLKGENEIVNVVVGLKPKHAKEI